MPPTGTLWSPRPGLRVTVDAGETAVTAEALRVIAGWLIGGSPQAAFTAAGSPQSKI
jgi:hypothetical protein